MCEMAMHTNVILNRDEQVLLRMCYPQMSTLYSYAILFGYNWEQP